jgi:hypothetical protein
MTADATRFEHSVAEHNLPPVVRALMDAARAAQPERDLTCVAFRTVENSAEVTRMGVGPGLLASDGESPIAGIRAQDLLVMSVTVSETTFRTVRTVHHILVARTAPSIAHSASTCIACRRDDRPMTDSTSADSV